MYAGSPYHHRKLKVKIILVPIRCRRRGVVSIAMKYAHVQNRKKARVGFDEGDDILIFEV